MFSRIAAVINKSNISKNSISGQKQFYSWNKIEKIALFIEDTEALNKNEADKFIEGLKKYVEVFFVELKSKKSSYGDWKCFIKKDRNLIGLPRSLSLNEVKDKKYDLAINISNQYSNFSANLISHLNAPFKCGNNNLYGELDLIIERKESQDLISYLKEVRKYLEMIKTGN